MVLSEKDLKLLKFLKVKGKLVSLAAIELPERKGFIERTVFFVLGNAKDMSLDEMFKKRISTLSYVMNTNDRSAKMSDFSTVPEYSRAGLGKSLFGYAFREMRLNKINKAQLRWNGDRKSWEFYTSLGFRLIDTETRHMAAELDGAVVHNLCVKSQRSKR